MTDIKHTSTPWEISEQDSEYGYGIRSIGEKSFRRICSRMDKEDAELIVRAVNSYEALLEAARRLINDIDNGDGIANQSVDDLKEAIKQAEERP